MLNQHSLIQALVDAGVSGYILKDDQRSIQELGNIVTIIAGGEFISARLPIRIYAPIWSARS